MKATIYFVVYLFKRLSVNRPVTLKVLSFFLAFTFPHAAQSQGHDAALNWQIQYDAKNRPVVVTDPANHQIRYEYEDESDGRLESFTQTFFNGQKTVRHFDRHGRLLTMSDIGGIQRYEYDSVGRLGTVSRNQEWTIRYAYDSSDRITSIEVKYGQHPPNRLGYAYDFRGRRQSISTPAGKVLYDYQTGKGEVIRTLPNHIKTISRYAVNGQLQEITHGIGHDETANSYKLELLATYSYHYRHDGRVELISEDIGGKTVVKKYAYDQGHRLERVDLSNGGNYAYTYDTIGNMLTSRGPDGKHTQTYDWLGRLQTADGRACSNDLAGNLTNAFVNGEERQFAYAPDNRLLLIDAGKITYEYDGDGNLRARTVNGKRTVFIPDPMTDIWSPLLAIDSDGQEAFYIWEGHKPLGELKNGNAMYYLEDYLGSIRATVDRSGTVMEWRDYTPFGKPLKEEQHRSNNFQPNFAGLFWDSVAGLTMTFARSYQAENGRFMQHDPLHQVPSVFQPELSPYSYCGSDPVNFIDLNGSRASASNDWFRWWSTFLSELQRQPVDIHYTAAFYSHKLEFGAGQFLNFLGRNSNWIGANRGGGQFSSATDSLGRYELGDTRIGIRGSQIDMAEASRWNNLSYQKKWADFTARADFAAEWHDVQDWVNWHTERGTEVRIPWGDREYRYVMSRGRASSGHNYEVFQYAFGLRRDLPLTTSPMSVHPIELDTLRRKFPVSTSAPSPVGGVYLGGAGQLIHGIGLLNGVKLDASGNLVVLAEQGKIKLPSLRIDDLVTVFRSVYLDGEGPTVTINPNITDPEHSAMLIVHSKATENTYVGWILYQADRIMKGYNLGRDNLTNKPVQSSIPGYDSVLGSIYFSGGQVGTSKKAGNWERFWIMPAESRMFAPESRELTLFDVPLKVRTQAMKWLNGKLVDDASRNSSPGAAAFTKWFTSNFESIASEQMLQPPEESGIHSPVPVFSELRRIALMTAIAEKLESQGVPLPFWMRDYQVREIHFEKTTPSLNIRRTNGRIRAEIFGGANSNPSDSDVHSYSNASDFADLSNERQATGKALLDRAAVISKALPSQMASATPLELREIKTDAGPSSQAFKMPGASTLALAPCLLEETDLSLPLADGTTLDLSRVYNSFFKPNDIWGRGWTMDLPRLEEITITVSREDDNRVTKKGFDLVTPLNSASARFGSTARVPEIGNTILWVSDKVGSPYLGMGTSQSTFLTLPTQQVYCKDGSIWHFDQGGRAAAWEMEGRRTVFEYDTTGRLKAIKRLAGRTYLGGISVAYNSKGLLNSATAGSANSNTPDREPLKVEYTYNNDGMLVGVDKKTESQSYQYRNSLLTRLDRKQSQSGPSDTPISPSIRQFEYNEHGQLISEINDSRRTDYRMRSEDRGTSMRTIKDEGRGGTSDTIIRYDPAMRPTEYVSTNGERGSFTYGKDSASTGELRTKEGASIRIERSPDGRTQSIQRPGVAEIVTKFDDAGRLVSIDRAKATLVKQTWSGSGQLESVSDQDAKTSASYDKEGLLSAITTTPIGAGDEDAPFLQTHLDQLGHPVKITDSSGLKLAMVYDAAGRIASFVQEKGDKKFGVNLSRDKLGRVQDLNSSWGSEHFEYGADGKLARSEALSDGRKAVTEFSEGRVTSTRGFDGNLTKLSYMPGKARDRVLTKVQTPVIEINYEYDDKRKLSKAEAGPYAVKYNYDDSGRVNSISYQRSSGGPPPPPPASTSIPLIPYPPHPLWLQY